MSYERNLSEGYKSGRSLMNVAQSRRGAGAGGKAMKELNQASIPLTFVAETHKQHVNG
jgi:hypothetical protein